ILRRFIHRSIREHLVAEHIAGLSTDQTATELLPHLWYDSDWEYIAPVAIAMHPKRDEVLRALLCRASRSGELPSDLSVIDATGEVRKLLARVAAQSRQDDWSPDVGTIIGQARVKLAQTSLTANLAEAAHWPTSNRQVRQALLRQLTGDPDGGEAARLAGTLAQLDPTADEKRQARAALLQQLTCATHSHIAAELTGELARLDPTAEDKRHARDAVLWLLALRTSGRRAGALLAGTLARLDPAAEDEIRQARETLLRRLARETRSEVARSLASTLAQLNPTAVDLSFWWAWAVLPTVELLATVRRNSTLEEWLEVLPSLSPLSA
ncbi:MAG: hypothetical protein ACRDS0_38775, partial [Pseudonocardiaceae bacterium]